MAKTAWAFRAVVVLHKIFALFIEVQVLFFNLGVCQHVLVISVYRLEYVQHKLRHDVCKGFFKNPVSAFHQNNRYLISRRGLREWADSGGYFQALTLCLHA